MGLFLTFCLSFQAGPWSESPWLFCDSLSLVFITHTHTPRSLPPSCSPWGPPGRRYHPKNKFSEADLKAKEAYGAPTAVLKSVNLVSCSPIQIPPLSCFHIQDKIHTFSVVYKVPWNESLCWILSEFLPSLAFLSLVCIKDIGLHAVPSEHTKAISTPGPLHVLLFAQKMQSGSLSCLFRSLLKCHLCEEGSSDHPTWNRNFPHPLCPVI